MYEYVAAEASHRRTEIAASGCDGASWRAPLGEQGGGREAHTLRCLRLLRRFGFCIIGD